MANPTIRFKRGTQSAFSVVGLNTGEPAFVTDEYNFYIGSDGTTGNNRFFGSSRYWVKENATNSLQLTLVNKDGSASNSIRLKSPDAHTGITTYTLPSTPVNTHLLTTNADGVLSWTDSIPSSTFTGITTFTDTTDNTLGNENTGSVQLDGGMGIAKNLTVKQNLHVGGHSEFVGVVTFKGGTINLGDDNTDNINVSGEFISNLTPNDDNTYDIGIGTQRWRNANFAGVVTATTFSGNLALSNVTGLGANVSTFLATPSSANLASAVTDETGSGALVFATSPTLVTPVLGNASATSLNVSGVSTFTGAIDANGGADISGGETVLSSATVSDLTSNRVVLAGTSGALQDSANLTFSGAGLIVGAGGANITGISTFSTDLVVGGDIRVNGNDIKDGGGTAAITFDGSGNTTITGNLNVNGSTTQVNTTTLTVEDNLIELAKVDGSAPGSDVDKDVGLLLHYYDNAARLGAVYWDDSASRIVLASRVGEAAGVLTVDSGYYADVEFKGLYITDTAGSGEAVVSYATIGGVTGRHLQNIIVDGGTF